MSTRQSEHVIYSSFVVKSEYTAGRDRYWWEISAPGALRSLGFDSEDEAISDAHRTFGMP